jgi:hypothetical protein
VKKATAEIRPAAGRAQQGRHLAEAMFQDIARRAPSACSFPVFNKLTSLVDATGSVFPPAIPRPL